MLTGELPTEKFQPPSQRVQVDVRIDEIVLRALEKTPQLRFSTAAEFRTQVESVSNPPAPSSAAAPRSSISAAALAALLLLLGVLIPALGITIHNRSIGAEESERVMAIRTLQNRQASLSAEIAEANAVAGRAAARAGDSAEREETRARAREEQRDYGQRAANLRANLDQVHAALAAAENRPAEVHAGRLVLFIVTGLSFALAGLATLRRLSRPRDGGFSQERRAERTSQPGSAALGPATVTTAAVAAVFYGIVTPGVPWVNMLRIQGDSAYLSVVVLALMVSVFAGLRVRASMPLPQASRWWCKPLSAVAWLAWLPVVGFAVFFAGNISGKWNPAPSEAVLVPLCFLGAVILPLAAVGLWMAAKPAAVPQAPAGSTPFSRKAVIGACWVPGAIMALAMAYQMLRVPREGVGPLWWQGVAFPLIVVAVAGPFGTTILGWLAVADIRRSRGKVRGLLLAVFDGLVYPLMALGGLIAVASVALAKMFVDFHAAPAAAGQPHPAPIARLANGIAQNEGIVAAVGVAAAIAADVFIVRAVMRAVRKTVPAEEKITQNQTRVASIALIMAMLGSAFGALATLRAADSWATLALAFLFGGVALLMAMPVRRAGAAVGAIFIATLGMILWPLVFLVTKQHQTDGPENVVIASDEVAIHQARYDREALTITFGPKGHRWTPPGASLDAMFDVMLKPHLIGHGATWMMKPRHGVQWSYLIEGPPGPLLGRVMLRVGSPTRESDGAYVIGEFRPDGGEPLPIAIKLEQDLPDSPFPASEHVSRNHLSVIATYNAKETELHYVLFYKGDFAGTGSSGTQNPKTNSWVDEGSVRLKNGRTFGHRREALYPDELHINGTAFDLKKGRVLVLRDDGSVDQLRFFPIVALARDPQAVSDLIGHEDATENLPRPVDTPSTR